MGCGRHYMDVSDLTLPLRLVEGEVAPHKHEARR
jgi:hypothetical protein